MGDFETFVMLLVDVWMILYVPAVLLAFVCYYCFSAHGVPVKQDPVKQEPAKQETARGTCTSPPCRTSESDSQSYSSEQPKFREQQRSGEPSCCAEMSEVGLLHTQEKYVPTPFERFINETIIEYFKGQRSPNQYQFAVVLLSDQDFSNNITHMTFNPCDEYVYNRPVLDNGCSAMPKEVFNYDNYLVARPVDNDHHSEEVIFGKTLPHKVKFNKTLTYESRFNYLWRAFRNRHSETSPKYVLLYSWNQPCNRCTDSGLKQHHLQRLNY